MSRLSLLSNRSYLSSTTTYSPSPTRAKRDIRSLRFPFKVLSLCGMWLPLHWESRKCYKLTYQIFSLIIVVATYTFVGLEIVLLFCSEFDVNFLADIMFTLLTAVSVCFKMMHFLARRGKVLQLERMLLEESCRPRDSEEKKMQNETDQFVKNFTIGLNFIAQATLFCHLITPLFQDPLTRQLPFRVWLPYELHDGWNYWITYGLEFVPLVVSILVNATTDVVVSGFVLQACTQLDFLKRRLGQLPEQVKCRVMEGRPVEQLQRNSLKQMIVHHDFIIRFAKSVTRTFNVIIVEQYVASVLLFSVIVYQFTLGDTPPLQKVMAIGYITCMTGELFSYCWFGNEITLKSLKFGEEIYKIDWTVLSKQANKTLIMIMLRTSKPIIMSYGNLVVLNISSFKTIMKVTFSAFNVLKKSAS